jgi:hypothetical protein
MIRRMEVRVTMMTTGRVPVGTRSAASVHRSVMVRTTATCVMSFMAEIHATDLKDDAKIECVMSWNSAMRETEITMTPIMISLTGSVLLNEDTFQEASRPIPKT